MSFEKRKLAVQILVDGNRANNTGNIVTIDGYRMAANVVTNGGMETGYAQVQVFGLPLSQINELTALPSTSTLGREGQNSVVILAQEGDKAPHVVFIGNIWKAWGAFESAPDTSFMMQINSGYPWNVKSHPPTSVKGSVDASALVERLAHDAGWGFENHGVHAQLRDPYLIGSVMRQIQEIKKATKFNLEIDRDVLHIWPRDGYRSGPVPVVGPGNKLVGYPTAGGDSLSIRTEFLAEARLGGRIQVQGSQLEVANGTWTIVSATHSLSSEMPGGPWFTDMTLMQTALITTPAATAAPKQ